jgi:hypothetical protein
MAVVHFTYRLLFRNLSSPKLENRMSLTVPISVHTMDKFSSAVKALVAFEGVLTHAEESENLYLLMEPHMEALREVFETIDGDYKKAFDEYRATNEGGLR